MHNRRPAGRHAAGPTARLLVEWLHLALVKDMNPDISSSAPMDLTNLNGAVFFRANDVHGIELWQSNGAAAGTVLVKDINPDVAAHILDT